MKIKKQQENTNKFKKPMSSFIFPGKGFQSQGSLLVGGPLVLDRPPAESRIATLSYVNSRAKSIVGPKRT